MGVSLVRLHGEPPGVYEQIGPTARRLAQRPDADSTRPTLEYTAVTTSSTSSYQSSDDVATRRSRTLAQPPNSIAEGRRSSIEGEYRWRSL